MRTNLRPGSTGSSGEPAGAGNEPDPNQAALHGLNRLSEDECWDFLARHSLGRVAVIQFQRPMVYPVNYVVDDNSIVFRTAPGSKLIAANLGKVAAFEVDDADELFRSGASVIVHGRLREITDPGERTRATRLPIRPWAPGERDHFVRVVPQRLTGRRIPMRVDDDGLGADGG